MGRVVSAVDLFCGAGGLTHGFMLEGIDVKAGLDIDPACKYPFEKNNSRPFLKRDISSLHYTEILSLYPKSGWKLLAGCAPCQPFSSYSQGHRNEKDEKWRLLYRFADLVEKVDPDVVTMENVPKLVKHSVFEHFVSTLERLGYIVTYYPDVNCLNYSIPQRRKRLVLFASRFGEIEIEKPTCEHAKTVRDTIAALPSLKAGEISKKDPLHRTSKLTSKNLERIRASRPGGTWRDWDDALRAECHQKDSGSTYPSVYGRMKWDEPSPTITTQCYGFGNGRFGHPKQDRALSLREAALLQSFPINYSFTHPNEHIVFKTVGRLIGNAVPVELARVIARSLLRHLNETDGKKKSPNSTVLDENQLKCVESSRDQSLQ